MTGSVWEEPESVTKFAARDPDVRLRELIDAYQEPAKVRILDLGCAGGRNSEMLARRGFDLHAVDASRAMVAHTRGRLGSILGQRQATHRVTHGRMADLGAFADATFDLVIALGVYHCAASHAELEAALAESARVLKDGGRLLVAVFTPETDLSGSGVQPVAGEPHIYDGLPSGRSFLVDQDALDAEMRRFGLKPHVPSQTVRVETASGQRVTVNALYRKGD